MLFFEVFCGVLAALVAFAYLVLAMLAGGEAAGLALCFLLAVIGSLAAWLWVGISGDVILLSWLSLGGVLAFFMAFGAVLYCFRVVRKAARLWWDPKLPDRLGPDGRPLYADLMSDYYDSERAEKWYQNEDTERLRSEDKRREQEKAAWEQANPGRRYMPNLWDDLGKFKP